MNTLVGLSIQDLENKQMEIQLTIPQTIEEDEIYKMVNNTKNKVVTMLIQTNLGNMVCKIIQKG